MGSRTRVTGMIHDCSESGLYFALRKLKFINQLQLTISEAEKVDLILMLMLPRFLKILYLISRRQ